MTGCGVPRWLAAWGLRARQWQAARTAAVPLTAVVQEQIATLRPDAWVAARAALAWVGQARLALDVLALAPSADLEAAATELALLAADLRELQQVTVGLRARPVGAATCWEVRWDPPASGLPASVTSLRPERGNPGS